jgi:hypothetical protein
MRRRGRAFVAAVFGGLLVTAAGTPGVHASGGPGGANGAACNPVVGGQVGATNPVPVSESATVDCPFASGPTGTPTGPGGSRGGPGPFQPGQDCSYVIYQPVKIVVGGGGSVTEMDPNATASSYTPIGYPKDLAPVPVVTQESSDIYMPYKFSGKADANGDCTVNVKSQLGCPDPVPFTNFVVAGNVCWQTFPHPATGGGIDPGTLVPFLDRANLLQFVSLGTISSRPDNPNPGLVNTGTCFFLNGATFRGLGGAPQPVTQPAFFTMSVSQPLNDGTGRMIFYVFKIELSLASSGIAWNFGDGSTTPDANPPGACLGGPDEVVASHTYLRYGTFPVSVTENFTVNVQEFWEDASGDHGPIAVPGPVIPPQTVPVYTKTVVQEEGVPVGGG